MDWRRNGDGSIQQHPGPGLLEHGPGQGVGAETFLDHHRLAVAQDGLALVVGETRPHQPLGEVLGRIDQHQAAHRLGPRQRRQQRHPAAHGRAHQHHRPGDAVDHGDGVLAPPADGRRLPVAAGPAVGEMVVAQAGPAAFARRRFQGQGLGPLHVRAEAADPDHGRALAGDLLEGEGLAVRPGQIAQGVVVGGRALNSHRTHPCLRPIGETASGRV